MEAKIVFCSHNSKNASNLPPAVKLSGNTVEYKCPPVLKESGFPVSDASFVVEEAVANPTADSLGQKVFANAGKQFATKRQNLVVFSYGMRSTPKRQLMYGSGSGRGYAGKVMGDAVDGVRNGICAISCFVMGKGEHVIDLLNVKNDLGVIVDSVKEGPRVRMVERKRVASKADVDAALKVVIDNYEKHFAPVLSQTPATPEEAALPPYNAETIFLQLYRYDDEEAFKNYMDANSLTFIALCDSERPVLCGIDGSQEQLYDGAQRTLVSAAGIVSSIRCSRLRIPFGKSKMSQLLRRAYNAERGNPSANENAPTQTVLLIHAFTDGQHAEESYHCLSMTRRISNLIGATGVGSMVRDLAVDKWRLDQDVAELRDELIIARTVYEYKPCIYDQAKPVANIKEEELKRITAIQTRRDEKREKQLSLIRQRAKEEAAKMIKEQEQRSGTTLQELEKLLEEKKEENHRLQGDREKRVNEYESALEKIRRKLQDEEATASSLKNEMLLLEQELNDRQSSIQSKQKQLEMSKLDKSKGREALLKERESVQAMRKTLLDDRRFQRQQWIQQIRDMNEKVLEQVRALTEFRKQSGEPPSTKEQAAEKAVVDDIRNLESYLPKLISLEDTPKNVEETEALRRQFDDMFLQEKNSYIAKIEEEKARKEKLEKGLEAYRNRLLDAHQAKKRENTQEAAKKAQHLDSLVDQVLTYLRDGMRISKISSKGQVRRRFFFLSDDCKRLHACELDHQGAPINRKKPPVTAWIKDIKKVVMGVYTSSFLNFSSESQLEKARQEAMVEAGARAREAVQDITPANLGLWNYRSFAIVMRGGKTLELVCDLESDCEAWLVALKRLLHIETPIEKLFSQRFPSRRPAATASLSEIKWGGPLDVRNLRGFVSLTPAEASFCSESHIPPAVFLRVKQEATEKSQMHAVTVYDVRVSSGLDLIRSGFIYDYLVEHHVIPLPF